MSTPSVNASDLFKGRFSAEKYQSSNPISRFLVHNFLTTLMALVQSTGATEVHEVGCGEGQILGLCARRGLSVRGCDFSNDAIAVAVEESKQSGLDIPIAQKNIYDLDPAVDAAELVICCEVLEHLTNPEQALLKLLSITKQDLIVSVPREPLWHILNMARGKYLTALGNTPGHINHWSKGQFVDFVGVHATIQGVRSPLPWTIVHCRPR
ncbi:class I SAM-dependent methyltransferase [Rhodoplanes serenus]|uniref:class I SAM-dependent methyltransferase n=1 Tax=Rhodoplanes serenus TaxID=200615 RepID=UPI000DAD1FE7|nr:class I SAM-dependent methyltransferase [Rhodoplanes serenus]RAI33228.1 hypothetical protein CH340_12965 [Rhodoplanes serenus]